MLTKRIIPCLDVKDGFVVKGKQYQNLTIVGTPVELAIRYEEQGADELIFLDINASFEKRPTMTNIVKQIARNISIPFTVGGGIQTIDDIQNILCAGADKVSINTAAISNPALITEAADLFGRQCIVVAMDAKRNITPDSPEITWDLYIKGGRIKTNLNALDWAQQVKERGAGELLPTSIDQDGMKNGYDIELVRELGRTTKLPVIASGGAGKLEHLLEIFTKGDADAALAASIFHNDIFSIQEVKEYLRMNGVRIRATWN